MSHAKCCWLGAAMVLSAACVDEDGDAGGPGPAPRAEAEAAPAALANKPCGAWTVSTLRLDHDSQLSLCVLATGVEVFVEVGRDGTPSTVEPKLAQQGRCALDFFLAFTNRDVAVPGRLLDSCAAKGHGAADLGGRQVVRADFLDVPRSGVVGPRAASGVGALAATYTPGHCSNPATFASACYQCAPYDDCFDWCVTTPWGWHARNLSAKLGEEGNVAMEKNVSCVGATRVRGWEREDVGDAWGNPEIDFMLAPNYRSTTGIIHHSVAIFGQDYDFRLRADSNPGAWHLHSGYFLDE